MAAARNGVVSRPSSERGLVVGGGRCEPSLKLSNHWIQGVCLQKECVWRNQSRICILTFEEGDGESPSEEDDNNQRGTNQHADGQQGAEQEPGGEEYGYSLESDSGSHQSQTAGRDDEEEQEEVPVATQSTDHQCGRRGPICGIASQLPFLLTTTANQAGQGALSSEENRQLRRVQRNDEDQRELLQNQQNAHENRNLFQMPGWTETGRRVQQCTEQHPPGGVFCDLGTGDPQV
ncbi:unnamed protein product, partial [Porites evermanni]